VGRQYLLVEEERLWGDAGSVKRVEDFFKNDTSSS
jgi:hypothetical protein